MKAKHSLIAILLAAAVQFAFSGCANTAKGVSADYHKAEDKVENAVK